MSNIISVITSPFQLVIKLCEVVAKYRARLEKKKRAERDLAKSFSNEIGMYVDVFERLSDVAEEIAPIFESIGDEFAPHDMNQLLEAMSDMPLIQADLVNAFIAVARACNDVIVFKGLMDDLKETDRVLYDFVWTMKAIYVGEDRVKIGSEYFRFFKTYEDYIFKEVKPEDLKELADKLKGYTKKVKHYLEKTAFIKRSIRKKWTRNLRVLWKASANITMGRMSLVDIRAYIPQKLLPITIVFDEFS